MGLGFYESLCSSTPVLTLNIAPNNELIVHGENGWLIDCDYQTLLDNNEGLIQRGFVSVDAIQQALERTMQEYNREVMFNKTYKWATQNFRLEPYADNLTRILNFQSPKKKTILIVGYYNLADGFKTCANFLFKDYHVLFFPLLYYEAEKLNIIEALIKYINGHKLDFYPPSLFINDKPIDIVLIWYHRYFCRDDNRLGRINPNQKSSATHH